VISTANCEELLNQSKLLHLQENSLPDLEQLL